MQNAQELYQSQIVNWTSAERLRLAALILNDLSSGSHAPTNSGSRLSAVELIQSFPPGRGFQTSAEADEFLERERDAWDR